MNIIIKNKNSPLFKVWRPTERRVKKDPVKGFNRLHNSI
jgi:hypothetical protein